MIGDDGSQERVLVATLLELAHHTVQRLVEGGCDGIELRVREPFDFLDPTLDAEDLGVDAQHRLDVPVLVGDLGRQQELNVVIRGGEQERREQDGDVELGVEAVREDPDERHACRPVERREAVGVDREVDLER